MAVSADLFARGFLPPYVTVYVECLICQLLRLLFLSCQLATVIVCTISLVPADVSTTLVAAVGMSTASG